MENLQFNTDINIYTIDELLALLNIQITEKSDVQTVQKEIIDKSNAYIKQFSDINRKDIVEFAGKMKEKLLGRYNTPEKSTSQQTLIRYENEYIPFMDDLKGPNQSNELYDKNGAGNPINRKTMIQLLNIDSRFRDNYDSSSPSDYLIYLPYTLQNVTEMKICDIELSTNYYPISESLENNYFWIASYTQEQLVTNTPTLYYIYIPSGNYYFADLTSYINTSLINIEPALIRNNTSYEVPISCFVDLRYNNGIANGTGKTTLGIVTNDAVLNNAEWKIVKLELNFEAPSIAGLKTSAKVTNVDQRLLYNNMSLFSKEKKFGWLLGFRKGKYSNLQPILTLTTSIVSESVPNILGPPYIYLIVNDFNKNRNNHFIGTSRYGLLPNDIIARISIKASAFNVQAQNDFSVYAETRHYFGPVKINKLRIQLVDEYGRFLDLNNSDFSFTIRITSTYSST